MNVSSVVDLEDEVIEFLLIWDSTSTKDKANRIYNLVANNLVHRRKHSAVCIGI